MVLLLAVAGVVLLGGRHKAVQPAPVTSAVPTFTFPTPLTGAPAPASLAAFAALPPAQQQAEMQQAIDAYDAAVGQAFRTLNEFFLPEVATGDELGVLQKNLETSIRNRQPESEQGQAKVLTVVMSPQPYRWVSIDVQATATDQYLDPTTLKPIGTPQTGSLRSSFTLVIENGVWKVGEHIQDGLAP